MTTHTSRSGNEVERTVEEALPPETVRLLQSLAKTLRKAER